MTDITSPLSLLVRRLAARSALATDDQEALERLPYQFRTYERGSYILRDGDPRRSYCSVVSTGLAYRHKITLNGLRQIIGLVLAGEPLDFQQLLLNRYDHSIQAATNVEVIELDRDNLAKIIFDRAEVGKAIWTDALITASISNEWIVNVGRRNAKSRVAHFFCEFFARSNGMKLKAGARFMLPMTQEQIGDVTGLTSVHVNRMIRTSINDSVIEYERPFITVINHERLCHIAGFDPLYLHDAQLVPS